MVGISVFTGIPQDFAGYFSVEGEPKDGEFSAEFGIGLSYPGLIGLGESLSLSDDGSLGTRLGSTWFRFNCEPGGWHYRAYEGSTGNWNGLAP